MEGGSSAGDGGFVDLLNGLVKMRKHEKRSEHRDDEMRARGCERTMFLDCFEKNSKMVSPCPETWRARPWVLMWRVEACESGKEEKIEFNVTNET